MRLSEHGHFASNWEEVGSIPTLTLRQLRHFFCIVLVYLAGNDFYFILTGVQSIFLGPGESIFVSYQPSTKEIW